ncbi:MAG: transporter substrate binding protein [Rhodospirillales bacterium]|nr:transporter substrate binding protein [Rhodospirillales bacterium]
MLAGGGALGLAPLAGCAWFSDPPPPLPVIGYLEPIPGDSLTNAINVAAFRSGLAEQGFVEGENCLVEFRFADGDIERLPGLAKDLVDLNVAVLVVSTPNAARAAKALTTTIPIVFGQAADAVENKEVENLAHPEANVTGVANFNELGPKRLRLLDGMVPPTAKIAYLSDPNLGSFDRNLRQTQEEADRLKRRLLVLKGARDHELDLAFARINMAGSNVGGLCVGPIRGAYGRPGRLVGLAARHPLPTMFYDRAFVDAGGLISYGAAFKEIYRLVGNYAGRILSGAQPGDLPVLQPDSFELVINLKTANALGLKIPPAVLAEASETIG